jgi:hypothetical protein
MKTPPTNMDDVIDSRDVIERIEELEDHIEVTREGRDEPDIDEVEECQILQALAEEAGSSPDWPHGEALIRDSYFETYAQELAESCCEIPTHGHWPLHCIDWEQAARELQQDYMSVEFDGIDYWIRA